MSVCFVVVPLVVGGWPFVTAAIVAAGAALGYEVAAKLEQAHEIALDAAAEGVVAANQTSVQLVMDDSKVVSDTLLRGESFTLQNGPIQAEFYVDGRGACRVHLSGEGVSEAKLEEAGRELMDRVRQQFAYAKVMQNLEARGFQITAQQVEESGSIRIRVQQTH